MALFEVPGWNLPANVRLSSSSNPRKRKRHNSEDKGAVDKLQSAEVNVEKLMKTLENGKAIASSTKAGGLKKKKHTQANTEERKRSTESRKAKESQTPTSKAKRNKSKEHEDRKNSESTTTEASQKAGKRDERLRSTRPADIGTSSLKIIPQQPRKDALTSLQSKMKKSLDGARFRWINETLYKSSSKDAEELMRENPDLFEEYHAGFRHQVTSWPSNPLEHFKNEFFSYPNRSVIVDLGCGDASLARDLIPKGFVVISFDLVAANPFIIAADICDRLPLPGSEEEEEGQIVDVVVCSLSLMSTNWLSCIREARRVLKTRGALKIAEVASRIEDAEKFTSVITSIGFRLVSKDDSNSHFAIYDFRKTDTVFDKKAWMDISSRGNVLQPCEYKKR